MSSPLHHYVSQLSLRRFGRGKMYQIFVFDKSNGKSFSGAANKLAAERELYDFEFMGVSVTLEPSLADLESEAALCIESILQRGRLAVELPEMMKERATIIRFLAVQFVRTAGAFAQQANLGEQLESMLRADGMPEDYFKPPSEVGTSENARKVNFASHICRANKDWVPLCAARNGFCFRRTASTLFYWVIILL